MAGHPIEGLMTTAMQSIKEMVDVNTIVGDAVQAPDGSVIIPISRVSFGFASGGGEYSRYCCSTDNKDDQDDDEDKNQSTIKFPFAGGSGAGVSINPVAFLVVGQGQIKLLPVNINSSLEKIIDLVPELIRKTNEVIKKKINIKKRVVTGDAAGRTTDQDQDEDDE